MYRHASLEGWGWNGHHGCGGSGSSRATPAGTPPTTGSRVRCGAWLPYVSGLRMDRHQHQVIGRRAPGGRHHVREGDARGDAPVLAQPVPQRAGGQ
ncbi:hypothetical protein Slala05_76270 [Streptomyces lavendulae subsp. lavendulae]|nr:hypothetical protein Slala05_76270 [Streptomyces lavendulae subsp. lavendulae]